MEIAFSEAFIAFALNDFKEDRANDVVGENLQEVPAPLAFTTIKQDLVQASEIQGFLNSLLSKGERERFDTEKEVSVYYSSAQAGTFQVRAYRLRDGELAWTKDLGKKVPAYGVHPSNTFASASPTTDGRHLFVTYGALGAVVALDFDGEEVWRTDREEGSNWSTPFVWENDVRTELVTTGSGGVRSYSLDGELLWSLTGMSSLVIPTPFTEHGLLYINSGYVADSSRPVYAIRAGASGDITLGE